MPSGKAAAIREAVAKENRANLQLERTPWGNWLEPGFFFRATADFIFIFFLFFKLKLRFFARFFLPPATIFQNFAKAVSLRGG